MCVSVCVSVCVCLCVCVCVCLCVCGIVCACPCVHSTECSLDALAHPPVLSMSCAIGVVCMVYMYIHVSAS